MKYFIKIGLLIVPFVYSNSMGQVTDKWTQKADYGIVARSNVVGFAIGTKAYIGCGNNGSLGNRQDFWEYNTTTDTWTQVADFPGGARIGCTGFSIGNKGYVGLGVQSLRLKDMYEYLPSTNVWTKKNDFGGGARAFAGCFTIGSKAYVGTGDSGVTGSKIIHYKDFWEYDPSTDTWTAKADFGGGTRWRTVGFSLAGKGYLGTGANSASKQRDFWEYDPTADIWTRKADYGGYAVSAATGFSIGGMGYIGTGNDYTNAYKADFWMYNVLSDSWTAKSDFGGGKRSDAYGINIGQKGYLGLGLYGPEKKDFWEYAPDSMITNSPGSTLICSGDSISIGFISSQNFSTGNVFSLQLSDATGSFASPTIIGTKTSIANVDSVKGFIPGSTPVGIGYRVRIVSTLPAIVSSDNGVNLNINLKITPTITIIASDTVVCFGDSVKLIASTSGAGTAPNFRWILNGLSVGKNDSSFKYKAANLDSIECVLKSSIICKSADSVISNKIGITVNPLPLPSILHTDTILSTQKFTTYQWYYNSIAISTVGNTQTLKTIGDGDYYVIVIDSNGCTNKSAITTIKTISIKELLMKDNVSLFPNPTDGIIKITPGRKLSIKIFNLLGILLLEGKTENEINLKQLDSGNYILQMADENGRYIGTTKVVKL